MPKQYHKNPRKITGKQMTQLAATLGELGDLSGIVHDLNTDELIGGNQRSKLFDIDNLDIVLTEQFDTPDEQGTVGLGYVVWMGKKFAYRAVRWDAETAEKANVVANKAGGTWDFDILANEFELDDLLEWGFEPFEFGLEDEKPEPAEDPGAQIDKADELQKAWGTALGQLWQLGDHRLICGDCTDAAVVERLMGGEKAVVFSDAPYGVSIVKNNKVGGGNLAAVGHYSPIVGDETTDTARRFYETCRDIGFVDFILWGGNYFTEFLPASPCWIVWDKRGDMNSNNFADCEMAWTSFDRPARIYKQVWAGMIRESEHQKRVHPTQKPIKITTDIMRDFPADCYFDGFAGSGTTGIACEQLGRKARMAEISPAYCAVILERWATMTGKTPVLID